MSFNAFKIIKQHENPDRMALNLLQILKNNRFPQQKLSQKEIDSFRKGHFRGVFLYPESDSKLPPENRKRVSITFQINKKGARRSGGLCVGDFVMSLTPREIKIMERFGDFIIEKHPQSDTIDKTLKIPFEVVSKLNPETIIKKQHFFAMIKISDPLFEKFLRYHQAGVFIKQLSAFFEFYAGEQNEERKNRLKTFFKKNGVFNNNIYENFIKQHADNILKITEKDKAGDEISKIVSEKFNVSLPAKNVLKLNEKFKHFKEKLNKDKKTLIIKEIERIKQERK